MTRAMSPQVPDTLRKREESQDSNRLRRELGKAGDEVTFGSWVLEDEQVCF